MTWVYGFLSYFLLAYSKKMFDSNANIVAWILLFLSAISCAKFLILLNY